MKINFTVELDKEFSELIQSPIRNFFEGLLALAKPVFVPPVRETPVSQGDDPKGPKQEDVIKETSDSQKPPIEEKAPQGPETIVNPEPVSEAPKPKAKQEGVKNIILETIQSRKTGIDAKGIAKLTDFTGKQISNNMFHLKKAGLVKKKKGGKFVAIKIKEPTTKG
jgi:hypothetical protein